MTLSLLLFLNLSAIGFGLLAGVFLGFSDFIMRSLARIPDPAGISAMQSINREVFRIVFMALFLGMVPVSIALIVVGLGAAAQPIGGHMIAAGGIYLIASFASTAAFNVPMNTALANLDAATSAAQSYWTETYLPRWTAWNTVRTLACLASMALLLWGQARLV